jgi:hypothetical protein
MNRDAASKRWEAEPSREAHRIHVPCAILCYHLMDPHIWLVDGCYNSSAQDNMQHMNDIPVHEVCCSTSLWEKAIKT